MASALDKDVAGAPLFRGVSFKLERGDRMTLAGRNGAGKTTLLRMLAGQSSVGGGDLVFEKGARVTLHDQRPPREHGLTLRDYVLAGCGDLVALEQRLRDLEAQMAERPEESVLGSYAVAQARLEHAGGWNWRTKAIAPLHGLGFKDAELDRPMHTFSGGELTRASLARALAGVPGLLLLDEPTNHLDISSLEWLEGYLTSLDAADQALAGEHPQQRGLAGPVASGERHPVAALELEGHAAEQVSPRHVLVQRRCDHDRHGANCHARRTHVTRAPARSACGP